MESILKAQNSGIATSLREVGASCYTPVKPSSKNKGPPRADLTRVPRPFLVSVANSIGMWNRFIPAFGLRMM